MENLSHWDFAPDFTAAEVAALIFGADPSLETMGEKNTYPKSKPILEKLRLSYHESWGYWHKRSDGNFEFNEHVTLPGDAIQSVEMEWHQETIGKHGISEKYAEYFDRWIGHGTSQDGEFSAFQIQRFSRKEITRWLSAIEMKSVYQFDPKVSKTSSELTSFAIPESTDKPLATIERNTLLTIIAALCKDAGYDHTRHAKTAGLIQSTAEKMGVSIGETTIEGHLKKIPDALRTRMK